MKNLKTWKRLARLAKALRRISPRLGRAAVDYVMDLYDRWGLIG